LSPQNDPFRLDTPTYHEYGSWLRAMMARGGLLSRPKPIHIRGIHYTIMSFGDAKLPWGAEYKSDDDCWVFLMSKAAKAARWLKYVPFDSISDERNEAPVIRVRDFGWQRLAVVAADPNALPSDKDIVPRVHASGVVVRQPFRLAMFGEKTSLAEVLEPISDALNTDLYLPTGEISDTLLERMAGAAAEDGRRLIVFIFADCDPSGFQMLVSIAHKLRAFKEGGFHNFEFEVVPVALTIEQVKDLGLPSTPLKDTEKRADGWRERYGIEQTEIDALATLQPRVLRQITLDAIAPFYDATLARRVERVERQWEAAAQAEFDRQAAGNGIEDLVTADQDRIREARQALRDLEDAVAAIGFRAPPIGRLPEPELTGERKASLVSSDMPLLEHIKVLRERKNYTSE
jgi:hypothetical protein